MLALVEKVKRINKFNDLEVDKSYIVFVGYSCSPSGFDIGTFNLGGYFEMQTKALPWMWEEDMLIYELPKQHIA